MEEVPYWWRVILSLAEGLLTVEVVIQQGLTTAFRGVKSIIGGAHNLTTSTYQHFARTIQAPLHVDDSSGFYTVLLAPGCEDIAPNCVLRSFDIAEDLRGVTAIAAGPRPFAITSPKINIDSWKLPTFYAYNPWNYTSQANSHDDSFLSGFPKIPILGTDPLTQILHLPSSEKALALVKQPLAANSASGDWVPVPAAATFLCIAVSLSLSYFFFWCVGWIPPSKKQWKKVNLDAYVAEVRSEESNKALVKINDVEQWKLQSEKGYNATIHSLRQELEQSKIDRGSVKSELASCRSDKATTESKLHKCTTEKEAAESNLLLCTSDKAKVEAELGRTVAACSKADEQVNILKSKVTEAKSAREEARSDAICAREEAEANMKQAQEEAANQVKAAEQNAEERVEAARQMADTKVKQAKGEADKAGLAQKEAEDKVESSRRESEKNFVSAQQEAKEKFDSAQRAARERSKSAEQEASKKFESAHQEAKEAAKLAQEDAEKNIKSAEKAAETKLNDTTATYKQHEKQLQDQLSTAKTTIDYLRRYRDDADMQSKEVASLRTELSNEREARRQDKDKLDEKHKAELEGLTEKHHNEVERLQGDQEETLQKLVKEHQQEAQGLKGEVSGYVVLKINLATANDAKEKAEQKTESIRQQLSQVQDTTRDYGVLKAEKEKLHSDMAALQSRLQETRKELRTTSHQFEEEGKTLQTKLHGSESRLQTATAQFEADKKSLQSQIEDVQESLKTANAEYQSKEKSLLAKCEAAKEQLRVATKEHHTDQKTLQVKLSDVEGQLEAAVVRHESVQEALQARVDVITKSKSQLEAENKDSSQKVSVRQEEKKSQAESMKSMEDCIRQLQDVVDESAGPKEGVKTELWPTESALVGAERSNLEDGQGQQTTSHEKTKRRNRRKHRTGRYSTDLPNDADVDKSDTDSVDLPMAQSVQQLIQQPLGSPVVQQVEELTKELSKLAFEEDTATGDGVVAGEAAETSASASDSGSSNSRSTFRYLPDAASFVPARTAQLAKPESTEQSEASSAPTSADRTRAEQSAEKRKTVEESLQDVEKRPAPDVRMENNVNVLSVTKIPDMDPERAAARMPPTISASCESLAKENDSTASQSDQRPVLHVSEDSQNEAENTIGAKANDKPATNLARVAGWGSKKIAFRTPEEDQNSLRLLADKIVDSASLTLSSIDAPEAVNVPLPDEQPFECLDLSKTTGHTVLPNRKRVNPTKDERRAQKAKGKPAAEGPANTSHGKSKPSPGSDSPVTSPPTPVGFSRTVASQCANAGFTTPTAETKLVEPKSGRPAFITEELAVLRAEDLMRSMWATQTSSTTESASRQTSAPCKAAQILTLCINDAKGNEPGKDLQSSRWASVASGVKPPVGTRASLPQQTVPLTTLSGKTTTSATAALKAMPPAGPPIAAKVPRPAVPAPVALAAATLPPATASPVAASIIGVSAVPVRTATAPNTAVSGSVAGPMRVMQYSSAAHSATARSIDIPQRGRGTGIGTGRGIGRGGGARGGRGRGRAMIGNYEVPEWLTRAEEARTNATAPQHLTSVAKAPATAVAAATPSPSGSGQTISQHSGSASSSRPSQKPESKNELSESIWATSEGSATLSKPAPEPKVKNELLQSRYAAEMDSDNGATIAPKIRPKTELSNSIRTTASGPVTPPNPTPKPKINHQLAHSKWATDGSSTRSISAAPKPKVKNDLLQSKYAT